MVGDYLDLMVIVRSARILCTHKQGDEDEDVDRDEDEDEDDDDDDNNEGGGRYLLSRATRRYIARSTQDVVTTFLAAEATHRRQFGIAGNKNPSTVRLARRYSSSPSPLAPAVLSVADRGRAGCLARLRADAGLSLPARPRLLQTAAYPRTARCC